MTNIKIIKIFSIAFVIFFFTFSNIIYAADIRIALRANKGGDKGLAQWQATADFLSEKIPDHRFIIVPFENNSALNQAVSLGNFHFCITNPASGVEHKVRYDAEPIATLVNKRQGKGYSQFGSVIFTRADRYDVNTLQDTKGKMFMGTDELGFGGWRVAWNELLENDINPYTAYTELRFAGGRQQDVVYAVRDKKVATGAVRTDMLERMAAEGLIKLSDYKVLNAKRTNSFPFLHSTALYPEWMFSAVNKAGKKIKRQVTSALFSINEKSPAAINGKYVKWIAPLDYSPVDDLLQKLKVGPYNVATMDYFKRLLHQYGAIFFVFLLVMAALSAVIIYFIKINKRLLAARDSLSHESELSRKLEKQLLHAQKVESLGQLTGGIAHDFNNMLASIVGFTELSLQSDVVKNDKKVSRYLNHVLVASEKSTTLINQMLLFSRSAAEGDKPVDISVSQLLNEVKGLLEPIVPDGLTLNVKNVDPSLVININLSMFVQVMMNLYLNAKDAVAVKNGYISITSEYLHIDESENFCDSCHEHITGDFIVVSVEDNGSGINSEVKPFIFDPFFSTKEVGKGTGMGLSTVHGIIHKYNGHIQVDTKTNAGSVFKILLPSITQAIDSNNQGQGLLFAHTPPTVLKGINKHVMVVDDEVSLTLYLKELLSQYDYTVTTFNDESQALEYYSQQHKNIDLVITDQTMLNISGIELSRKMFQIEKNVPVIIYSGDKVELDDEVKSTTNIKFAMQKPLQINKLFETIESLIV